MAIPTIDRRVILQTVDDNGGMKGLTDISTIDYFDAFHTVRGVWHDIWEHYFENNLLSHNRFKVEGEIVASGCHLYFYDKGLRFRDRISKQDIVLKGLVSDSLHEILEYDESKYVNEKEVFRSNIVDKPNYKELTYGNGIIINEFVNTYRDAIEKANENYWNVKKAKYIKTVTDKKIKDLVTYGYLLAKKECNLEDEDNFILLDSFIDQLERILHTDDRQAYYAMQDLCEWVHRIQFDIKNIEGKLSYDVHVSGSYEGSSHNCLDCLIEDNHFNNDEE